MNYSLVQTTCDSKDEAKNIAKILIEAKLAACVQISKIDSIYTWKNELCEDKEYILNIKTKIDLFEEVERKIKENHSYDVPEIIQLDITNASKEYKKFIGENTK